MRLLFMCFSAAASFTASAVLGGTGVVCLTKVKEEKDYFLASIPFLFALQQLFEGFVWLRLMDQGYALNYAYLFLFFAFLLWPIYVPYAVRAHETDRKRRRIMSWFIGAGILSSAYLFSVLTTQTLQLEMAAKSLRYDFAFPLQIPGIILYIIVTVGSLLLSTNRFIYWFGLGTFFAAYVSWEFYTRAFASVWCFFSALLSLIIVGYFLSRKEC